jgi:hypothetical protein
MGSSRVHHNTHLKATQRPPRHMRPGTVYSRFCLHESEVGVVEGGCCEVDLLLGVEEGCQVHGLQGSSSTGASEGEAQTAAQTAHSMCHFDSTAESTAAQQRTPQHRSYKAGIIIKAATPPPPSSGQCMTKTGMHPMHLPLSVAVPFTQDSVGTGSTNTTAVHQMNPPCLSC